MRCSAWPTTCTAAEIAGLRPAAVVEAVLFTDVLKPVAAALGPAGDLVIAQVVQQALVRAAR